MLDQICDLIRDRKITIFFSSHLLEQVQRISDRIGIMIQGKLVAAGPTGTCWAGLGLRRHGPTPREIYMKYFMRPEGARIFTIYLKEMEDHFNMRFSSRR
jgi:ABC-type multidrug transport system ATPase subunit